MQQTVAFIGLGLMGQPMAKNVLTHGYRLRAYNRTKAKAEELRGLGAEVCGSPREAAQGADLVITMVADPPALAAVLEGPDGAFAGCQAGTLVIDMSTVDPVTSRRMDGLAGSQGVSYLEAPVTGGVTGAEQGTLTIMVGGRPEDFTVARPLLATMGRKILHVGAMGMGAAMKLATNLVASMIFTAMAEALVFATKAGVDPLLAAEVLAERSPLIAGAVPRVLAGQFEPRFPLKLAHKDVHLALDTARSLGVPLFALGAVGELYTAALARELGGQDQIAVIRLLEGFAGVRVRNTGS